MADGSDFVSFDVFLREAKPPSQSLVPSNAGEPAHEPPPARVEPCRCANAISEVRRFHAALADALDFALERLLRDIACDVLARELSLGPADVAAIAARALTRYANESPLRIRVHPEEIFHLDGTEVPVVADSELRRGDVAIDVQCGTIDAGLGARLLCALERAP